MFESEGSCRGGHFAAEPKKDFDFLFKVSEAQREIATARNKPFFTTFSRLRVTRGNLPEDSTCRANLYIFLKIWTTTVPPFPPKLWVKPIFAFLTCL